MMKKLLVSISLALIVCLQVGCESNGRRLGADAVANYDKNPLFVELPATMEQAQAIDLAESVLIGREWEVSSKNADGVVGKLVHRGFDATTTIKPEGNKLVIYSQAIFTDNNSGETQPGVPFGWLKNLQTDLVKLLY